MPIWSQGFTPDSALLGSGGSLPAAQMEPLCGLLVLLPAAEQQLWAKRVGTGHSRQLRSLALWLTLSRPGLLWGAPIPSQG